MQIRHIKSACMQSQYAFGLKLLKRLKLAAADLQMKVQARRIEKNSGGATKYEIWSATMVGR